jgi:hypothetical protein
MLVRFNSAAKLNLVFVFRLLFVAECNTSMTDLGPPSQSLDVRDLTPEIRKESTSRW